MERYISAKATAASAEVQARASARTHARCNLSAIAERVQHAHVTKSAPLFRQ